MTCSSHAPSCRRRSYHICTYDGANTVVARNSDRARRDGVLASGAQIISTDYLKTPNLDRNAYHLASFASGGAATLPWPVAPGRTKYLRPMAAASRDSRAPLRRCGAAHRGPVARQA
ncbi:hypothetical protein ENE74_03440 [Sphingobium algorifonticola]|uniref:Uncharacterized protein n=1 Tax=Sphingobium algorifonticola TaxID=2008318 RepID=A0A437JD50_9SPHN|nr:hypothetical protein ENE74_03440 [Sphingobium algorifonticola]